jgi:hypothetical protein
MSATTVAADGLVQHRQGYPIGGLMQRRRFPPPWSAELTPNCFIVRDGDGQQLAYVYYESEPGRRSAAKLLTKDEARRNRGEHRQAAGAVGAQQ